MNIPQVHKLSNASQLSLLAVVILLGAVFFTVNSAMQEQNKGSHASTVTYSSISIRGESSANNGTGATSLNLTLPSGVLAGDVLFAQVVVAGSSTVITAPSGWTLVRNNTSSDLSDAVYYHVATGVDPKSFIWQFNASEEAAGGVFALVNVNTSTPVDTSTGQYNASTTSMTAQSVTTNTPVDKLLFFGAIDKQVSSLNAPSGMSQIWVASTTKTTSYLAEQLLSTEGATGNKVGNHTVSGCSNISQLVAVMPASYEGITQAPTQPQTIESVPTGTNMLQNPLFENTGSSWLKPWIFNALDGTTATINQNTSVTYGSNDSADIDITKGNTSYPYYVQLLQTPLSVTAGQSYTLSFWAKSSVAGPIQLGLQENHSPWTVYKLTSFNLTTSWALYSVTYTQPTTDPSAQYIINLGGITGNIWLDEMSMVAGTQTPTYAPAPTTVPTLKATPTCAPPPVCYSSTKALICAEPLIGWCGYSPTPSPTILPTVIPTVVPTLVPGTPTTIPTTVPTVAVSATPTPIYPSITPLPTDTPEAGDTVLSFTIGLQGLGTAGDAVNPNSGGNMNPERPSRTLTATVYDAQNQLVVTQQGIVNFNDTTGLFQGTVDLGQGFATGLYTVKVKADQYLRAIVPGIQTITEAKTNTMPNVSLIVGDINGDNEINILDYNILMGCYSDLLPAQNCTPANNILSDLNNDGAVNEIDYNLFLRELSNVSGQ
jgi:hypothetical protein